MSPSREKSSVEQIRRRFDQDVERFSNLETGQTATIDAPLVMELVTAAAAGVTPHARAVLDIGCGAGNYSLKLLKRLPGLAVTLVDLSQPMLRRAVERLQDSPAASVTAMQGDVRELPLPAAAFDIVMAAAVLHHLRSDDQWQRVFEAVFASLRPGGSFWIADMVEQDEPAVQDVLWRRYGEYLMGVGGDAYRDKVFAYIEEEDTPRSLVYQLDLLRRVGFAAVEVLHKNGPFAAFGAIKR
jgi:tRNA (cmo5U34)-methyltransferase